MTDLVSLLVEVLPKSGEWRFPGQRDKWVHAVSLMVDMEMDNRKQAAQRRWLNDRVELANIRDVGACEVVIFPATPQRG